MRDLGTLMQFDWSISIGNILTAIGFVFGCIVFAIRVRSDVLHVGVELATLEKKIGEQVQELRGETKEIRAKMDNFAAALITIGRQDERLNSMEKRIGELSTRQYENKRT
jgi:uncharacterized protein YoxC